MVARVGAAALCGSSVVALGVGLVLLQTGKARADADGACHEEQAALLQILEGAPRAELAGVEATTSKRSLDETSAVPIGPRTGLYLERIEAFVRASKCPAQAARAQYRLARLYYEHHQLEDAARSFRVLLDRYPAEREVSGPAFHLLMDTLVLRKQYEELGLALARYCAVPQLRRDIDPSQMVSAIGRCESLDRALERRRIEGLEQSSHWREAALGYQALADRKPVDPRRDEFLYNQALLFERAGDSARAEAAWKRLRKEHATSPLAKRAGARRRAAADARSEPTIDSAHQRVLMLR